jgi:UDP-hydrolysing UDP-N-acetyl-D-glucosamine 2-epimerase
MQRRKVCVVLVDRANYGRLKPVMRAIAEHPEIQMQVVAAGTMVLGRFGRPVDVVRGDGFAVDSEIYIELEGSTPATMAKSVGFGVVEFASEFQRLGPDLVLLIGDRYEALAAAVAAAYMNICIVHVQGGEVSGSIDESARHAITKFAHYHFPSTRRSAEYLLRMGEHPDSILGVGCPSSDIARDLGPGLPAEAINGAGSGAFIDPEVPFQLVIFHPTTTEYGGEQAQMRELLHALNTIHMPTVLLWPNIDAGSDHISKAIRVFRDQEAPHWLRTLTNLKPDLYLKVLRAAACAVGNSSSFVRDASYFGTPVVLVGDRQEGRESDVHVVRAAADTEAIVTAIRRQLQHGRYAPSTLYGDGNVSARIAESLGRIVPYRQKRLHYIHDEAAGRAHAASIGAGENEYAGIGSHHGAGRVQGNSEEEYRAVDGQAAAGVHG